MAKITISDLPEDMKISAADLSRIRGGAVYARLSQSLFKSYSHKMIVKDYGLPFLGPGSNYGSGGTYRRPEER